jgi:hypothetical protein
MEAMGQFRVHLQFYGLLRLANNPAHSPADSYALFEPMLRITG